MESILSTVASKFGKIAAKVKNEFNAEFSPLTYSDKAALYKEYRSFSGFLPYSEYLDEVDMVLLEDHVSVAALWEIEPRRSEGLTQVEMEKIESDIVSSLSSIQALEQEKKRSQYVLTSYVMDVNSLEDEFELIAKSVHPKWKDKALTKAYLDSLKQTMLAMESKEGLFKETMSADDSESSKKPYRGGRRRHIMMLYRRVPLKERKGNAAVRAREIELLDRVRGTFEATVNKFARASRMNREDFYSFIVRLLNPAPLSAGANVNRLLKENPCPPRELAQVDGDYATSMLHSRIETDSEHGTILFDGQPARFLQVERMNKVPEAGMLTAEKVDRNGRVEAAFDNLPKGAVFVQQTIFCDSDDARSEVDELAKKTQHNDDEARLTNAQCERAKMQMAKGRKLHQTDMGVFIFATDYKELSTITEQVKAELTSTMGLRPISPENNLFPIESFIRHLPLTYDPALDHMRKRGKASWLEHSVSFMPFFGRTRGHISRTRKVCSTYFNRRGEAIFFDPMDYDGNCHSVLLGPSGLGKSATLNKKIVEYLIFKDARIYIAEAGESFDPLMDFLEAEDMDVQRVNISAGSNSKPVAPLEIAKRARDDYLNDLITDPLSEAENTARMLSVLEKLKVDPTHLKQKLAELKQQQQASSAGSEDDESAEKEERKDYLGEAVLISRLMITGGDIKEEDEWRRQHDSLVTEAVIDAANLADALGQEVTTPGHLRAALNANAEVATDPEKKATYSKMADNVKMYTQSVRGRIFNQQAEPFKRCDCLHIELGIAQRAGYEDILVLAYLSLMNMINNVAESKFAERDPRPIFVITDEAHLILKDPRIAPVAVKIVRMWRKYGAWFLPATQDIEKSFQGEARAILGVGEIFYALKPPPEDLTALCELASLDRNGLQARLIEQSKAEKYLFTEMAIINKNRREASLVRVIQPSFTLALAGTEGDEKDERSSIMNEYKIRMAGASLVQALRIDKKRRIITEDEYEDKLQSIVNDPKYQVAKKAA